MVTILARCPICEELHEWQVADGGLGMVLSADSHPKGTRLTKGRMRCWNFRAQVSNNLQMLYALLQAAFRKTGNAEAREVPSDTSRRIAAMGTAQEVFYSARSSTDVSGQIFVAAVCANAGVFFGKEVSIDYEASLCRKRPRCRSRWV
jgi:Histidine kinase